MKENHPPRLMPFSRCSLRVDSLVDVAPLRSLGSRARTSVHVSCVLIVVVACTNNDDPPTDAMISDVLASPRTGEIFVIQTRSQQVDSTAIGAVFGAGLRSTTLLREDGPCTIEQSTQLSGRLHNAGQMRVTGGGSVVLLPAGIMYQDAVAGFRYMGGETLLVETMGATVPAFSKEVVYPHPVTGIGTLAPLFKSQALTLTWMPTLSDVLVQVSQGAPMSLQIKCTFQGASGSGSIPASAFAELLTSEPGAMLIATQAKEVAVTGEYTVSIDAYFAAEESRNNIEIRE